MFLWETTPLSFSDWQGWKVASIGLGTDGKMTFDAHQVQRLYEMWSHHGLGTVAPGGINTHSQSYGPKFWLKNQDEIDPDWHPVEGAQLSPASVRKVREVGGSISTGGNKKRLQGVIGELEVYKSEQPEKKQRRTMASTSASASAAVALPSATAAPAAESIGMEAVVDESVVKQESLDEMMAPNSAPPAVPVCDALYVQTCLACFKRNSNVSCVVQA